MIAETNLDWQAEAACVGEDPEIFFPQRGDSAAGARAQRICMTCPVRIQCKQYKKATKSTDGIWGGEYSKRKSEA